MATSPRMRVTWTGIALAAAIGASVICALLALLVRSGLEFSLALLAAAAILVAAFACRRAEQDAAKANAKLSDDVTIIAQRLLRLESRAQDSSIPEPSPRGAAVSLLAADLAAMTRVVSSLAESVGAHDQRLGTLEQAPSAYAEPSPVSEARDLMEPRPAPIAHETTPRNLAHTRNPHRPHAEVLIEDRPRSTRDTLASFEAPGASPGAPQDEEGESLRIGSEARPAPAPMAELSSRDDLARAASAILNRLRRESLQVVEAPRDEAVLSALEAGAVELHLQPVVMLPQRRTAFYATFPHLRQADGTIVAASEVAELLLRRGQRPRLDAFALAQARAIARHLAGRRSGSRMAVRLSRSSLGDAGFVQGAARLLREGPSERLILTIDHAEIDRLSGHETAALDAFRSLGATLALDAVADLDQDWSALARRGYGIAMLDIAAILSARPHGITLAFTAEAARSKIQLVATGVDRDDVIPDLLDFDLPLAMGPGLAPPRPVRSDVLAPPPAPEAPEAAREDAAPPREDEGPVSFRDFLRRAG